MRSLVVAPQWIGDAVMSEPLLRRLHARGEQLTVGALPWVAPVYRAMPQVSAVIEFPFQHGGLQFRARRALAQQIEGRFDTAYVLPNSLKSALLPFLASIPRRVGYLGEARVGLLTHRVKNPAGGQRPPMVAFYLALAGAMAKGETGDAAIPHLSVAAGEIAIVLAGLGLQERAYVVFAPGAEFGPAKRWPADSFAAVARGLNVPAVLLGSGKESALCEEIVRAAPGRCINLAGKTSLAQALAVIAGARQLLSNDSGLMHVAAALALPQVAVFGSSSPLHTPPLNPLAHVLWLKNDASYMPPLDCAPCFERECPLGHTRCLRDISPERVLTALAQQDDRQNRPAGP